MKLQLAGQAIPIEQLRGIAAAELRDVERLKAKYLGEHFQAAAGGGETMGDMIIADVINQGNTSKAAGGLPSWATVLLTLAAAGLGGGGLAAGLGLAAALLRPPAAAVAPPAASPHEWQIEVWREGGETKSKITPVQPGSEK